jgi:hypothetical protein
MTVGTGASLLTSGTGSIKANQISGLTATGAIPYVSGSSGALSQDASNLFWDSSNHRLGVGTSSFNSTVDSMQVSDPATFSWTTMNQTSALSVYVNEFSDLARITNARHEAVCGGVEVPSTANMATGAGVGIAGYSRSASTKIGSIGVYGAGLSNANNTSTFGMNSIAYKLRQSRMYLRNRLCQPSPCQH